MTAMQLDPDASRALCEALGRMQLLRPGETPDITPLTGGVSSLIVRVDTLGGPLCMKRALPQLKVAALWEAPVERNRAEVAWMRVARQIVPHAVPAVLGDDAQDNAFAMAYLEPADFPVWKTQLLDGHADPETARGVGQALVAIHAATSDDPSLATRFANDLSFHALRLEPYFEATARKHPEYAQALHRLVQVTAQTRRALVHGDVSPKNILVGPQGPVFLDAECAWYGDPAFDLAFCLNHMLLKSAARPAITSDFLRCFEALAASYLPGVRWEPAAAFEARCAALLGGLLLARIDGKSPAEYITAEPDRERVRRVAASLLREPARRLSDIIQRWSLSS
ncbi:MAG: aminoglycoside phosphotransferase family protein [Gammaproteobacteria bacterium]|nr:aminoglycoside phosphotransferase family protein [Gammaproteobacteria bacterium]MBU1443842.1 aminoglycoside phosphotransferase family protein [Gammaproteobacteria bacterium]MBU2409039.1 aminoglycoside phosphotransferase family protein [Gammaproteobacteria bacterium]